MVCSIYLHILTARLNLALLELLCGRRAHRQAFRRLLKGGARPASADRPWRTGLRIHAAARAVEFLFECAAVHTGGGGQFATASQQTAAERRRSAILLLLLLRRRQRRRRRRRVASAIG